ncbi:hypothetical protein RF11_16170 [Thelohanellus kitauei]|uniref:Uncharacterized protein n=1 Tax=Thelohanellus kitauei TaxID=669202 RepID=A0A0C2NE24_THEKT|nr:hypothetical protein RF11_16170 [Thelohanellus kitauei]
MVNGIGSHGERYWDMLRMYPSQPEDMVLYNAVSIKFIFCRSDEAIFTILGRLENRFSVELITVDCGVRYCFNLIQTESNELKYSACNGYYRKILTKGYRLIDIT